jgi:pimeloyl-ACP methyl ester carboxylesterase
LRLAREEIRSRAVDGFTDALPDLPDRRPRGVQACTPELTMYSPSNAENIAAPESRRVVLASGVSLSYVEQGDSSGVPLILLHGYSDSWRSFVPMLASLPRRIRAIAISLRGHGDSDRPAGHYDATVMAADVAGFMDRLGIARAVIAGHSMGSLVAQRFAISNPRRTLGLVLLGAFHAMKGNADVEALWRDTIEGMTDPVDPQFVRDFQQSTLARPVQPAFFETVVAESLKMPAQVWRAILQGLLAEDFTGALGRITAPAVILWGDRDVFAARRDQEALASAIRGAQLVVYPGAGHALHWEHPHRAAADIAAFIAGATVAMA